MTIINTTGGTDIVIQGQTFKGDGTPNNITDSTVGLALSKDLNFRFQLMFGNLTASMGGVGPYPQSETDELCDSIAAGWATWS